MIDADRISKEVNPHLFSVSSLEKVLENVYGIEASFMSIYDFEKLNGFVIRKNKKQLQAHNSKETFLLYGGAMGGGKTAFLVNEAIFHCLQYPGARVYLCRHELTSFKKTTYLELEKFLPIDLVIKHNRSDCFIMFKNGSAIYYGGLGDDRKAIERLKSMELSAFAIDQAEETQEKFFHMLSSRLRLSVPGIKYRGWLTANPTNNWVKERFISRQFDDHTFIAALPKENAFLPKDYEERLRKTLPEELIAAWIEGDWDQISEENTIYSYQLVMSAMQRGIIENSNKRIVGVDVARFGNDETVISERQGMNVKFLDIFSKKDTMETVGRVVDAVHHDQTIEIFVDAIGVGSGVADRLRELNYKVRDVVGSERAFRADIYKNKRAENYFACKSFLPDLSLPYNDKLRAQMTSIRYKIFSNGLFLVESKDELRARRLPSPDRLDSIVLTFANEVNFKMSSERELSLRMPVRAGSKNPEKKKLTDDEIMKQEVLAELRTEGIL